MLSEKFNWLRNWGNKEKLTSDINRRRLEAAADSLWNLALLSPDGPHQVLKEMAQVLYDSSLFSQYLSNDEKTDYLLRLAVAYADRHFLDEMHVSQQEYPARSPYFRQHGFREKGEEYFDAKLNIENLCTKHFITPEEAEAVWHIIIETASDTTKIAKNHKAAIKEIGRQHKKGKLESFSIIVADEISLKEAEEIGDYLDETSTYLYGLVNVRARFSDRMSVILQYHWKPEKFRSVGLISNLNRQEVWLNFLRSGRSFFNIEDLMTIRFWSEIGRTKLNYPGLNPETEESKERPNLTHRYVDDNELSGAIDTLMEAQSFPQSTPLDRLNRRRSLIQSAADRDFLVNHEQRLENLYRRHFGHSHGEYGTPEVILTRSGYSANVLATRLAEKILPKSAKALISPGWYFETKEVIESGSDTDTDLESADVYYLNAEPNIPTAVELVDEPYLKYRRTVIMKAITRALRNPRKEIILIIDRTTDLNWDYGDLLAHAPANLYLIETASFTKHQRGEKNYFFGTVWVYGPEKLQKYVGEAMAKSGASLTGTAVCYFPEQTPSEIEMRQEVIRAKQAIFTKAFNREMLALPPEFRWRLDNYNYFTFFQPPIETLAANLDKYFDEFIAKQGRIKPLIIERAKLFAKNDFYRIFLTNLTEKYDEVSWSAAVLTNTAEVGIPRGESFGLADTKLVSFGLPSVVANYYLAFFRMSPGVMFEEPEKFVEGAKAVAVPVIESMQRVIKADFYDRLFEVALNSALEEFGKEPLTDNLTFILDPED